mmetsp:Transcript_7606/g.14312  ORF Transcript_7606/g.14312 Transcript_7606/m.14312 type:complete len:218 (-) Transcript_7606:424-1077(-)
MSPDTAPKPRYSGSSTKGLASEYSATLKESRSSSKTRAVNAAIAEANKTYVTSVLGLAAPAVFSLSSLLRLRRRGSMTSMAKKQAAMGALKPAATPPAAPQAKSKSACFAVMFGNNWVDARATAAPSSTAGPSGPSELPVPRVTAAEAVRTNWARIGTLAPLAARSLSTKGFSGPPRTLSPETASPPRAGIAAITKLLACKSARRGRKLKNSSRYPL